MRDLQKPRAERGQPVQIGLNSRDIAPVTFGKRRCLGLGQSGERQQKRGGKQGAAEHTPHVDRHGL
jgi:hypothetical protein